jgi:hypothetical protein
MENRINIAELLKDCPKGMELDCALFEGVYLEEIIDDDDLDCPVLIKTKEGETWNLTSTGCWDDSPSAKCVIFPKGKTTWEGFVPPYEFKDGDMLATNLGSVFYLNTRLNTDEYYGCYVGIGGDGSFHICAPFAYKECCGLATEEEKQKLSKAIKDNGYKWNAETKTLDKLIEPSFKVGNNIRIKGTSAISVVTEIKEDCYMLDDKDISLLFKNQDKWELVPNKFDITTLIPFESRVLVRDSEMGIWLPDFFGCLCDSHDCPYMIIGGTRWKCCIPFEGNEHLMGKADDCDDFYKNWE